MDGTLLFYCPQEVEVLLPTHQLGREVVQIGQWFLGKLLIGAGILFISNVSQHGFAMWPEMINCSVEYRLDWTSGLCTVLRTNRSTKDEFITSFEITTSSTAIFFARTILRPSGSSFNYRAICIMIINGPKSFQPSVTCALSTAQVQGLADAVNQQRESLPRHNVIIHVWCTEGNVPPKTVPFKVGTFIAFFPPCPVVSFSWAIYHSPRGLVWPWWQTSATTPTTPGWALFGFDAEIRWKLGEKDDDSIDLNELLPVLSSERDAGTRSQWRCDGRDVMVVDLEWVSCAG